MKTGCVKMSISTLLLILLNDFTSLIVNYRGGGRYIIDDISLIRRAKPPDPRLDVSCVNIYV